jgi:zinc and cadmium transporter
MSLALVLTIYCICVLAASLAGGVLPSFVTLTHRRMQLVMSFVGGMMLGVALLHLLPHSLALLHSIDQAAAWMVAGLVTMFLLIRVFHVHAHEHGDTSDVIDIQHTSDEGSCEHHHEHHEPGRGQHPFSWVGLGLGLSLHTLIDGVALGAAVMAEAHDDAQFRLLGLGTFLAVTLHKPLDALSITSLMAAGGWSRRAIQLANVAFGLLCPLAMVASAWGFTGIGSENAIVGVALAFAAGVFLCISLADLLPEVAFHAHDRFWLTVALLAGIALAWSIGLFEPAHTHGAPHDHHEHASSGEAH